GNQANIPPRSHLPAVIHDRVLRLEAQVVSRGKPARVLDLLCVYRNVIGGDKGPLRRQQALIGACKVELRNENSLALEDFLNVPNDALGQGGDLLGGQCHPDSQVQGGVLGRRGIDKGLHLGRVTCCPVQESLPSVLDDLITDKPGIKKRVTTALRQKVDLGRTQPVLVQEVVGTVEGAE